MKRAEIFMLDGEKLSSVKQSLFDLESIFQEIVEKHPQLLNSITNSPYPPVLIKRESGIADKNSTSSRWSIDHLFVDTDGVPILVEIKRAQDTRLRREVIGQIIEYASHADHSWTKESLLNDINTTCEELNLNKDELKKTLYTTYQENDFWDVVKNNLKSQNMRLVLVADDISGELETSLEWLNDLSPIEFIGLEIKKFDLDQRILLLPRTIGMTNAQKKIKSKWTEVEFQRALGDDTKIKLLNEIELWSSSKGITVEMNDSKMGSKAFKFNSNTLFTIFTDSNIQFRMGFINNKIFNNNSETINSFIKDISLHFGEDCFTENKGFGNILLEKLNEPKNLEFYSLISKYFLK